MYKHTGPLTHTYNAHTLPYQAEMKRKNKEETEKREGTGQSHQWCVVGSSTSDSSDSEPAVEAPAGDAAQGPTVSSNPWPWSGWLIMYQYIATADQRNKCAALVCATFVFCFTCRGRGRCIVCLFVLCNCPLALCCAFRGFLK